MRSLKPRMKQSAVEICPWQFPDVESQRRAQDVFSSFSFAISHQPLSHHKISHSLQSAPTDHPLTPARSCHKQTLTKPPNPRTLSVIKDYLKKYYTEQPSPQPQSQSRLVFRQPRKKLTSKLSKYQSRSSKKMSVVDFAFNPALPPDNYMARLERSQVTQKDHPGSRIMKIRQQMIRSKQRKKIDNRQLHSGQNFTPDSRTMPLRVMVRQGVSLKKSQPVPNKSLGSFLQEYLERSE